VTHSGPSLETSQVDCIVKLTRRYRRYFASFSCTRRLTGSMRTLRRQHLKRTLFQPLDTNSTQQAEKTWNERKRLYEIVFQNPAFPFIIEEFNELIGCLPPSLRQHADTPRCICPR
jgi:hypothetical protein